MQLREGGEERVKQRELSVKLIRLGEGGGATPTHCHTNQLISHSKHTHTHTQSKYHQPYDCCH